jgi:hypothetical protein
MATMLKIVLYSNEYKKLWNDFIQKSTNGVFLFFRDYMDYHSNRFADQSLLFFENDKLIALLPANREQADLVSHGGLTFGGIVTEERMSIALMLRLFEQLALYLANEGCRRLIYKPVPHIYHRVPSEEDLYLLFIKNARLVRRDLSTTIALGNRLPYAKGRKWSINKAKKAGLIVRLSADFESFMTIEEYVLRNYHGTKPVHSAAEIRLLAQRFPENIKLFAAYRETEMLAGVVIYESAQVAHAQYIAATDEGREVGASDLVLDHLIREVYSDKAYFDFGISTEQAGYRLNSGLALYKENFGGRAIAYDCYEFEVPV